MMNIHPDDPAIMPQNQLTIEDYIIECISQIRYDKARYDKQFTINEHFIDNIFADIQSAIIYRCRNREHYEIVERIFNLTRNIHYSILILNKTKCSKMSSFDYNNYINKIRFTLDELVKDSYEDEKRRLEVDFGLVDSISELLICEINVFGITPDERIHSEAKCIRKFIANLLTNLVYGNAQIKRKLCSYPGFIENVTVIIRDCPCLTVFYAALIRNLSWNADETTKNILTDIISVLCTSSIRANTNNDQKCLISTLSALWNLGSHSDINKKLICESSKFLQMIINLLDNSPENTILVENASGVLKYACGYFIRDEILLKKLHGYKLIKQLIILLNSSSITIVASSINILSQLIINDKESKEKIFKNNQAVILIDKLRNSSRQDIRNDARIIFDQYNIWRTPIYQYTLPPTTGRMMYCTPRYNGNTTNNEYSRIITPKYNQTSTLPRNLNSYTTKNIQSNTQQNNRSVSQPPEDHIFLNENEVINDAGIGIPESLLGTRSGSIQSLIEEVTNLSWQSSVNTDVANSLNMSPVSESEIPDSPTEFAAQQVAKQHKKIENNLYDSIEKDGEEEEVLSKVINSALPKSSRQQMATPHLPKNVKLSNPIVNNIAIETKLDLPRSPDCCSDIDFDDSIIEDVDNQPTPPMASATSSVASSDVGSTTTDGSTTTTTTNSKNEITLDVQCHHSQVVMKNKMMKNAAVQPSRDLIEAMKESSLLQSPTTKEKIKDASCLYQNLRNDIDDGELSDDSYCYIEQNDVKLEDLTEIPEDVDRAFLAEKLIIDCGSLNRLSKNKPSNIPKPSSGFTSSSSNDSAQNVKIGLLSAATIKRLSKSRHPLPLLPPKTKDNSKFSTPKSAKVKPFNYQVNGQKTRNTPNCQDKGQSPASKLLVTTV